MDADILDRLRGREPIFHHPELGVTRADFDAQTVDDYWEIGASGRSYERELIWATLERRYAENADDPWSIEAFEGRQPGPDTYLVTYILEQPAPRPERLVEQGPDVIVDYMLSLSEATDAFSPEVRAEYVHKLSDPETIHAICEEYWKAWADDATGGPMECGQYRPEEAPEETIQALTTFLTKQTHR